MEEEEEEEEKEEEEEEEKKKKEKKKKEMKKELIGERREAPTFFRFVPLARRDLRFWTQLRRLSGVEAKEMGSFLLRVEKPTCQGRN